MSLFAHRRSLPQLISASRALLLSSLLIAPLASAAPRLDVPYVPTPHDVVHRMLEMADVQPDDRLIDLGSGDGRIVVAAAKDWNVQSALGIDLDPERIAEAHENARQAGVEDRVTFEQGDLFEKDISDATVLTMYLLTTVNERLRPVILDTLKPGTRVVSHSFGMGVWEPDEFDTVSGSTIYMWIVPAKVGGQWQLTTADGDDMRLQFQQNHQQLQGSIEANGNAELMNNLSLRGEEIRFYIGRDEYVGKVDGDRITPVEGTQVQGWHASRI